ncbi:hypothetical protein BIY21_20550 [Vibrio ponticus]|uniref:Uncharacterized protein n=1 Tax=Vibrio ponticus TaxID=265668 RepID=A0ABX3FNA1_9VIBR|nr:hypothetical protein [Vibrio ponticus]OLQ95706.1 hypothetical protein BIY21_20550 [Vibrio ponticus]
MRQTIKFTVLSNIVVVSLIALLEATTGFLGIHFLSDYAFYAAMILWGISGLLYLYPPESGISSNDKAEVVTSSMVDSNQANAIDDIRQHENTLLFIKFFVAGCLPMVICVLANYLT